MDRENRKFLKKLSICIVVLFVIVTSVNLCVMNFTPINRLLGGYEEQKLDLSRADGANITYNDDGTITLYFKVGKDTEYWKTYYSVSTDGKNWAAPRELVPGDNSGGRGPVKNKPIRLKNGTILAPGSTELGGKYRCFVDISTDNGKTWNRTPEIDSTFLGFFKTPMIQPTLWESKDGSVHMFTRTKVGKIYRSDSYDGGKTWCSAYPTNLPNNNSGIDLDTDDSGRIFLVYNPVGIPGIRTPLTLAVSTDDGKTFTKIKTFERGLAEYSYPAVVVKGDTIHITYTYERDYIAYWQIKVK